MPKQKPVGNAQTYSPQEAQWIAQRIADLSYKATDALVYLASSENPPSLGIGERVNKLQEQINTLSEALGLS